MKKTNDNTQSHRSIIEIDNLTRTFDLGRKKVYALSGISLRVKDQDFAIIYGPSGCGKSTLLNIISGADEPTSGQVTVNGQDIFNMTEDDRSMFRSKKMGIIYQMFYWIRSLNAVENVAMPLIIEGMSEKKATAQANQLLRELGIFELASQVPTQLSGGEQQKIGFARAVIANPDIIIADEPTGNLDSVASDEIMELFQVLNQKMKKTIILVTHNQAYWDLGTKQVEMKDGRIVEGDSNG
jgi:putative ABC transport system ATP-binding protein